MTQINYILLIVISIVATLGDIGASSLHVTNSQPLALIAIWIVLFMSRSQMRTTMSWSADNFFPLAVGCALIYTCGNVISTPSMIWGLFLSFGAATFAAVQKMQEG